MDNHGLTDTQMAELKASWAKEQSGDDGGFQVEKISYKTELSEYKGNSMITIFLGEKRIVGFGLKKAAAIVDCYESIKKFVDDNVEGE